jgi:hypothetical protein
VQDYKLHAEGWLHEIMRCLNIDGSVFITGTYHNIGDEIDVSVVIDYPVAFHPGQETPRCCTASVDRPTFAKSNGASAIASSRPAGVPFEGVFRGWHRNLWMQDEQPRTLRPSIAGNRTKNYELCRGVVLLRMLLRSCASA